MKSFYAGVMVVLLVLTGAGCGKKKEGPPPAQPPVEVTVVTVKEEPVSVITELPGRISPVRVAEVRARVPGILLEKKFQEGADVKAGDLLFQIDPAPLKATISSAKAVQARAEANLKQAQSQANRYKELVEINAVSRQEFENATASVQVYEAEVLAAKATVETAGLNLGYASVTAPISGRIGRTLVTEGALVGQNEATPMAVIQQLDPVYFDFTQSTTDLLKLQRALKEGKLKSVAPNEAAVTLILEDGTTYPQAGRLLFTDISVEQGTGMVTLRAEFPNPDRTLLPGMFARAKVEQAVNTQAITVLQRAVTRGANGSASVMLVKADETVESRMIKADTANGDRWIVASGLKAGERVVVEGLQKIRPGAKVTTKPFDPNAPLNTNQPPAAVTNATKKAAH
ncbi:MAG TPA: efflux RND transporter periplasmic adaptor subunit [Verrucomicrobiae bacterium]